MEIVKSIRRAAGWSGSRAAFGVTLVVWVALQVYCLAALAPELDAQPGDAGYYVAAAMGHAVDHAFYPAERDFESAYINSPGYVNLLILYHRLTGTLRGSLLINFAANLLTLFYLYKFIRRASGSAGAARLGSVLFMAMMATALSVMYTMGDPTFCALSMASAYYALPGSHRRLFVAGVLAMLAVWVRPVGGAWIVGAVVGLAVAYRRVCWSRVGVYLLGVGCVYGAIALKASSQCTETVVLSTTGGLNMRMGANDMAYGAYCVAWSEVYDGTDFEDLPCYRKDEIFRADAMEWIAAHPWRWLGLIPAKMFYLLETPSLGYAAQVRNRAPWLKAVAKYAATPLWFLVMVAAVALSVRRRRRVGGNAAVAMLLAVAVCVVGLSVLTVGMPRYGVPLVGCFAMLIAMDN
jgi:hypothetical protein